MLDDSQMFTLEEVAGVRQLLDRAAIWDCLMRYARGVDRIDPELVRSALWPDAHDSHGEFNGSPDDFINWFLPSQSTREVAQHLLSSFSVAFTGVETARSETYFISVGKTQDSEDLKMLGGRYDDEWERREGAWRVSARLVIMDWSATADATNMAERLAGWHVGSRDRNDPSYSERVERRMRLHRSLGSHEVLSPSRRAIEKVANGKRTRRISNEEGFSDWRCTRDGRRDSQATN